jgi:hypothetical protein
MKIHSFMQYYYRKFADALTDDDWYRCDIPHSLVPSTIVSRCTGTANQTQQFALLLEWF